MLDPGQEENEADKELDAIFATVREIWHIPADLKPDLPLPEIRQKMIADLPANWASRELIQLREEGMVP